MMGSQSFIPTPSQAATHHLFSHVLTKHGGTQKRAFPQWVGSRILIQHLGPSIPLFLHLKFSIFTDLSPHWLLKASVTH